MNPTAGLARAWGRLVVFWQRNAPEATVVCAAVWFVGVFATLIWIWGVNPLAFPSPDEAVNRLAASLVGKHGTPLIKLPFADPENLAHPRSWITIGSNAVPSYAPVMFYAYGFLTRFGRLGFLLITMLPAAGAAAFAAGTAQLMPAGRRWLGIFAPALSFPALYWMLHPWMNISTLLIGLCWAIFFFARWRSTHTTEHLVLALFSVGAAAAVRPDYAAFMLAIALVFFVAAEPAEWRKILLLTMAAGALALGANLVLNKLLTGQAFHAAYQIEVERQFGKEDTHGIPGLGVLRVLLIPMGIPSVATASRAFAKYWLHMGPIAALLVAQIALVPILRRMPRARLFAYVAGVLLVLAFTLSRLQDQVYGAELSQGSVHHSVPRYLSPVYLLAALPPLLFLGAVRRRTFLIVGTLLVSLFSLAAGYQLFVREQASFAFLAQHLIANEADLNRLAREIPSDALVYSVAKDKVLWSRFRLGTIDELPPTAESMSRAVSLALPVFVVEPKLKDARRLDRALSEKKLRLVRAGRGFYRVVPL